jgi:hypothetical protein
MRRAWQTRDAPRQLKCKAKRILTGEMSYEKVTEHFIGNPAVFGAYRRSVALRPRLSTSLHMASAGAVNNTSGACTMSQQDDICS